MQHVLVALKLEKLASYSIFSFAISLFGCPVPLPCSPPLCMPLHGRSLGAQNRHLPLPGNWE